MDEKITTIPLSISNAYLVGIKNGFVLIDTGMDHDWNLLEKELISAGCLPKKLKLVVLTHGDYDHSGNCYKLQEKYKSKIAMHNGDSPIVETGKMPPRMIRSIMARIMIFFIKLRTRNAKFDRFKPDIYLTDGQSLTKYGFNATLIHIPGHTKGSVAILTKEGKLFSGDTLINTKKPATSPFIENIQELKKSLMRIKNLDFKMIYPGHGKPFPKEGIQNL